MRPARLPWLTSIAVALTLVTAGSGVQAQDPAGDDFCAIFTPEEVGDIVGAEVTAEPVAEQCTWSAPGLLGSVNAQWFDGSLADQRAADPDGSDLTVGGRAAYYAPLFFDDLFVEVDGGLFLLTILGFDEVEHEAALTELGELALSRLASFPPPPATLSPDVALESLFPETIGGQALVVASVVGEEAILGPSSRPAVGEALGTIGKTFDDLSGAFASSEAGTIIAYRVAGADASAFLPLLIEAMFGDDAEMTPAQVAGKEVTLVASAQAYTYPAGEVLWVVLAEEPALTEILTALP